MQEPLERVGELRERLEELRQHLSRLAESGEGAPAMEVGRLLGDVEGVKALVEVLDQQLRGVAPES
ncbi:MAG: hypothetical protein M3Q65_21140 [Chloroflexota bacterium]|nr:hypothetical protein [Chloroflexota bacterium]